MIIRATGMLQLGASYQYFWQVWSTFQCRSRCPDRAEKRHFCGEQDFSEGEEDDVEDDGDDGVDDDLLLTGGFRAARSLPNDFSVNISEGFHQATTVVSGFAGRPGNDEDGDGDGSQNIELQTLG